MTKEKKAKKTSIGGQAVLEGVMMRGEKSMATAVRDQDGIIRLEAKRITPATKKNKFFGLPIIRGIVSFVSSMVGGINTLTRSAEVYGEGEPSKFEKWMSEKLKINVMDIVIAIAMILGLGLAILLFMVVPTFLTGLILNQSEHLVWFTVIEGLIKIAVFVGYIGLTSLLKDIKRTYMYHGAEHKTISCYEKGMDLTVENVRKCPRVHDRCGTTFMFFVIFVSIVVFIAFNAIFPNLFVNDGFTGKLLRVLIKIALLPLVAGLSYELLRGLSKTNFFLVYPLKLPGLLLQRLTTREPDDGMIEVAITAFNKVLAMDADPNEPETRFVTAKKLSEVLADVKNRFAKKGIDESDGEWIVSIAASIKRSDLKEERMLSPKQVETISKWVKERERGKPLAYILGNSDFYGYIIDVNENVLIPRPETEELVMHAIKEIKPESKVLDLCTGSGAIAVAVQKKTNANVFASDISEKALCIARKNAETNKAAITFVQSDLFENIDDTFDFILTNPPYILSDEIDNLQPEVKNFEPRIALDGGRDGLDFYRKIASEAKEKLNENGVIFAEFGIGQAEGLRKIFDGYSSVEIIKDINGTERILKAVK
ncbi:MAG: peptide chain release factor N(5)-glutamine methyltransferase [bacterium]|nr:peptide chain release factor N(5)-glutamine methyltransferase [bacterium]